MPLIEEMERTGAWLFRWRGFLPVILVPAALYVAYTDDNSPAFNDPRWLALCLGVGFIGQIIRAFTIAYVPKGTSGRNTSEGQVAETLNSKGMYGFVRHPLYTGNYFMWLGILLLTGNWTFTISISIAFWIYYTLIAMTEERFLRGKFGDTYLNWASEVPAFFPRTIKWLSPGVFFSFRNVLKREYNGTFAMVLSYVAVDTMHVFREGLNSGLDWQESIQPSPFMQTLLTLSSVAFLILRFLKKRTKILDVEGREYT
jgi:protein-S-isoprenylcysteine O-methyltransferase Ste14